MSHATFLSLRPTPDDPYLAEAWAHTGMRWAMMQGQWREHAEGRIAEFFAPEVREFLPPPETSSNPALSLTLQLSTLYDDEPIVVAYGETGAPMDDADLEMLVQPWSWSLMQDVLEAVVGLNETYTFTGYSPAGLYTKIARPHEVIEEADPDNPDQPIRVKHLEASRRPTEPGVQPIMEWTWTTWDRRDPAAFKVEAITEQQDGTTTLEDVTRIYWPNITDARPYPFYDRTGKPIWTWTAYHRRISGKVRNPFQGREVWDGTLTYAAMNTWWLAGFRDGAHPQRYTMDAAAEMAGTTEVQGKGVRVVRMNQMGVISFKSLADKQGQASQFAPAMDPKSSGEAKAAWAAELAVYAGVAPQDVSLSGGSVGMSGYAIALSRDGQRRARRKLGVPMAEGDRLRLAQGAALLNAYTSGPPLPEDPDRYRITYAAMDETIEEMRSNMERDKALREAKVLGIVDLYQRYHPGVTREQAVEDLVRIAEEERDIAERTGRQQPPALPPPDPDDDEEPPDDEE